MVSSSSCLHKIFCFSQVEKKERGETKARLCFQAGKFEVLCLEVRFRVQQTV